MTKFRTANPLLLLSVVLLAFSLCTVSISSAAENGDDFPWELFIPAFIKKPVDTDKDGFTRAQGDCNDSDPKIHPNATEICGDGIDQDCDGKDLPCPPPCADISGFWNASETIDLECCLGNDCGSDTISGTASVFIQQDGCNVSYVVDMGAYGTVTRAGTIDGNSIQMSGLFVVLSTECTATENRIDLNGTVNGDQIDLNGSGIAEGICFGQSASCTGTSTATFTR